MLEQAVGDLLAFRVRRRGRTWYVEACRQHAPKVTSRAEGPLIPCPVRHFGATRGRVVRHGRMGYPNAMPSEAWVGCRERRP